jgi:hypothetical protein
MPGFFVGSVSESEGVSAQDQRSNFGASVVLRFVAGRLLVAPLRRATITGTIPSHRTFICGTVEVCHCHSRYTKLCATRALLKLTRQLARYQFHAEFLPAFMIPNEQRITNFSNTGFWGDCISRSSDSLTLVIAYCCMVVIGSTIRSLIWTESCSTG